MSQERNPNFIQPSHPIGEIQKRVPASWETVSGMLELRTHNNSTHHMLLGRYKNELRGYYDYVYDLASGTKPTEPAPLLPSAGLAYHFRIVRETVFGKREKITKGWAKHIRDEKAASNR